MGMSWDPGNVAWMISEDSSGLLKYVGGADHYMQIPDFLQYCVKNKG